jgi:hypothetical protein
VPLLGAGRTGQRHSWMATSSLKAQVDIVTLPYNVAARFPCCSLPCQRNIGTAVTVSPQTTAITHQQQSGALNLSKHYFSSPSRPRNQQHRLMLSLHQHTLTPGLNTAAARLSNRRISKFLMCFLHCTFHGRPASCLHRCEPCCTDLQA